MKQSEFIMGSYSPMFFILRGAVCIFHAEEVEEGSEAELDTAKGAVLPLSVQPAQNDNAGFVVVALDQNENVGTRKINLRVEHEEQRKVMMDNFREVSFHPGPSTQHPHTAPDILPLSLPALKRSAIATASLSSSCAAPGSSRRRCPWRACAASPLPWPGSWSRH
mmetsp:Transcript_43638/g.136933  ORF Transcript_43638/g.136933 Transcript_43638/m.136933 type:complete len:165 (-) Transcript_43638:791-1285(-)